MQFRISALLLLAASCFFSANAADNPAQPIAPAAPAVPEDTAYDELAVFTRALQIVRQDYVDDQKVVFKDLVYGAMRGMVNALDPHSQFMEPDDFKDMQDDTRSEFGGVGIVVSTREGALTIVTPMEDSPGSRAGLLPGDQIVKVNGASTEKMALPDVVKLLRGEIGSKVTITVLRPSTREIKDYDLFREVIKVTSVKDAKILDASSGDALKIGYVRVTQFNVPTAKELSKKLDDLEKQGMRALVLDLRNNPGGLLEVAVAVCGEFLPANKMVVYTKGRAASQNKPYKTEDAGHPPRNYPLAILTNGGSASGSEIVAGALKDLNRAIVVGETTFGKGSVQSVIQLPDGSAMRLTTAKYYTPGNQVIHEHGVSPTILAPMTPEQERLLQLQRREDMLGEAEKKQLAEFQDTQLDRAVDALKGVMIFTDRAAGERAEAPKSKQQTRAN